MSLGRRAYWASGERRRGLCSTAHPANELLDPMLGTHREDFTPVFAEVVLRQQLNLSIAEPGTGGSAGGPGAATLRMLNLGLARGTLVTLPCAYLCPRHEGAAGELPWRMDWPGRAAA